MGLVRRIGTHSPDLVILIQKYLALNGEGLESRVTYSGGDPSVKMLFHMVEGLLYHEQLRIEMLEQTDAYRQRGEAIPGHLMVALSDMVSLEPAMLQNLSVALEVHLQVWNAARGDYLSDEDKEKKSKKKKKKKENRGRWGSDV